MQLTWPRLAVGITERRAGNRTSLAVQIEWIALAVIGLTFTLRLWAAWAVGLGYAESYYFSCVIRPSLSYFDHPPLAMWTGWVGLFLIGEAGPLALRLPFLAFFAGTSWLCYAIGRRLYGPGPALLAVMLLNLSPVFTLSTATFLQPDGPLMFFWLAAIYCLCRILFPVDGVERKQANPHLGWWLATGVSLGLAMLSKYHAAFLVPSVAGFVIVRPEQRHWLRRPGPYLALAIAAVLFSPVLVWNYEHGWISFLWQGKRGLESAGIRLDWLLRSLGGQALWLLPWIWWPLVLELMRGLKTGRRDATTCFVTYLAAPPILFFTAVAAYAPIGFHFHWQAPGYLLLFLPLGATIWRRALRTVSDDALACRAVRRTRLWLAGTVMASCIGLGMITTHTATGWWTVLGPTWLGQQFGEPEDPTLECLDFAPLGDALAKHSLFGRSDLFVFTNRWFQSGKVDYALGGQMPVLCLHRKDPRGYAFWNRSENWLGKDAVLVSTTRFLSDPAALFGRNFESIEFIESVPVCRAGVHEMTLHLHLCRNYHTPFTLPY